VWSTPLTRNWADLQEWPIHCIICVRNHYIDFFSLFNSQRWRKRLIVEKGRNWGDFEFFWSLEEAPMRLNVGSWLKRLKNSFIVDLNSNLSIHKENAPTLYHSCFHGLRAYNSFSQPAYFDLKARPAKRRCRCSVCVRVWAVPRKVENESRYFRHAKGFGRDNQKHCWNSKEDSTLELIG